MKDINEGGNKLYPHKKEFRLICKNPYSNLVEYITIALAYYPVGISNGWDEYISNTVYEKILVRNFHLNPLAMKEFLEN